MKNLICLVVGLFAFVMCMSNAVASDTVQFQSLLGKKASEATGCNGEWEKAQDKHGMKQHVCRSFNGPSDFKGKPVIISSLDGEIQSVTSQLPFDTMEDSKSRYESLGRYFLEKDGCSFKEEDGRTVLFNCSDADVLITWASGTDVPGWPLTIIYMQDFEVISKKYNEKQEEEKNEGL